MVAAKIRIQILYLQIADKSQKSPNFDESYLDNLLELEGKWAHLKEDM